ncbi:hypothetical protein DID88_010111 [Monilinia fructigena]|uniref:Uncharacterized protein n=1 Tax=Monilinia fructigena TaxID=38457 RepID=A0A395IL59_9HELO|nr:hypothetical protein DID88_010111 [Monilinia fructigena]
MASNDTIMSPPYPPKYAGIGLTPTNDVDTPITAPVFMILFLIAAIIHMTILQINFRRGQKFLMSGMALVSPSPASSPASEGGLGGMPVKGGRRREAGQVGVDEGMEGRVERVGCGGEDVVFVEGDAVTVVNSNASGGVAPEAVASREDVDVEKGRN